MTAAGGRMAPGVVASNEVWVESDRQKDAARSLEMVNAQLVSAAVDPYSWTWVLLSVHRAIRTFIAASSDAVASDAPDTGMVSSPLPGLRLQGSADRAAVGARDDLVASYRHALEATGSAAFPAVTEGLARMARIHDEMESLPDGWALRLNDLPGTTRSCLKVCEQLGWSPGAIRWVDGRVADLARAKYKGSVQILDALDGEYNGN